MTESVKKTVAGKEYTFKILTALEYGNILDTSEGQQASNRKLLAESTGLPIKEINDLDFPLFSRLLIEFHQSHIPKGIEELAKDSRKSST